LNEMADIHKLSEQMIDVAERMSNVADAAAGKRGARRTSGWSGWVVLPAVGAGLYALVRSDFISKQAKGMVDEAKSRATDLPSDLMKGVRQATQKQTPSSRSTAGQRSSSRSSGTQRTRSRSGGQRRRQSSSARKSTSGR
jgi:hypothetical protein